MSLMFPDVCTITKITRNSADGSISSSANTTGVKCYIEFEDTMRRDAQGTPIEGIRFALFPKGTDISMDDFFTPTTVHGETPSTEEAVRREVTSTRRIGGNRISHIEVITRSSRGV